MVSLQDLNTAILSSAGVETRQATIAFNAALKMLHIAF